MGPFTIFYDAAIEDAEDRAHLDQAWQTVSPLLDAVDATNDALAVICTRSEITPPSRG